MSKLSKIKTELAKLLMEFGSISTDKGIIFWEGEEDIKKGDKVYSEDENGEKNAIEDGDYTLEDGRVVTVKESAVESISEKEENPKEEVKAAEDEVPQDTETEPKTVKEDDAVINEIKSEIEDLYNMLEKLIKKVGGIDEEMKKVCRMSADFHAEEVFEKTEITKDTKGDKRLERALKIFK